MRILDKNFIKSLRIHKFLKILIGETFWIIQKRTLEFHSSTLVYRQQSQKILQLMILLKMIQDFITNLRIFKNSFYLQETFKNLNF